MTKLVRFVVSAVLFGGMALCVDAAVVEVFSGEGISSQSVAPPAGGVDDASVVRHRFAAVSVQPVRPGMQDQVVYPFFADAVYTATVSRVSQGFGEAEIIEGVDLETGVKSLSVYAPDGVRHEIYNTADGHVFLAVSRQDGTLVMQEVDPMREPQQCGLDDAHLEAFTPPVELDAEEEAPKAGGVSGLALGDAEIDLMIVFDAGSAAWVAGNAGGAVAMANAVVARMNASLLDSGIACVMRLVDVYFPDYASSGDIYEALDDVTDGVGGLSGVAAQRTATGADMVCLMIDSGASPLFAGLAWLGGGENYAFSACAVRSANSGDTMSHEIGHNFGCGHSKTQISSPGPGSYSYAAGFYFTGTNGTRYRTVMAYASDGTISSYQSCGMYSTPLLSYAGTVAGDAVDADNARCIRERMDILAAYRSTVTQRVTVAFDAQSGTVSTASHTYTPGAVYGYLPMPFRTGFMFEGWYTGTNGSGTGITKDSTVSALDTTLYAHWQAGWNDDFTNAIVLSGISGTASGANVGASLETGEPHTAAHLGQSVWWQWTAPENATYRWNTWGSSFDTVLFVYTGNSLSTLTVAATNDNAGNGSMLSAVELDAVAGHTYYIKVDGKGAAGTIGLNWKPMELSIDSTGRYVSKEGVTDAIPITAGLSWNVSKPAGVDWITYASATGFGSTSFVFTVASNPGAYRTATLTFSDGGQMPTYTIFQNSLAWLTSESAAMAAASATAGKKVILFAGTFTCVNTRYMRNTICERPEIKEALEAGYILWYCDVNSSGEYAIYADGLGFTMPMICIIDPAHPGTYIDRTTARQEAGPFLTRLISGVGLIDLTLDANGDGLVLQTRYAIGGAPYGELPSPTRDGYVFDGWYNAASNGVLVTSNSISPTVAHTIYGYWLPTGTACTVAFDAQGGSVSPATKIIYAGIAYDALPVPTLSGYLFSGWFTEPNGMGDRILSSTIVTATTNHTLYATWYAIAGGSTVYYVDSTRPDDSGNGTTASSAKKTIQAAIDLTADGDAVLVLDGIYAPIVCSNKSILIYGLNGAGRTIIDGGNTQRCARLGYYLTQTNTVLTGFTLRNGRLTSTQESDAGGAGAGTVYGTVNECTFVSNYAVGNGGGAYYGELNRCTFIGNSTYNFGGGVSRSVVHNSFFYQNETARYGGGAYRADLNNCTIIGNRATGSTAIAGGVYEGTTRNCIIWGNTSMGVSNNHALAGVATIAYSCTTPLPTGAGNIDADPLFADEGGRLSPTSPCINMGSNSFVFGALDLAGNERIQDTTVDMGAYESSAPLFTTTTPVPVPYSWLLEHYDPIPGNDYEALAHGTGANGIPVWQSFVACLNPTVSTSRLVVSIHVTNGLPVVDWQPRHDDTRAYQIIGVSNISDARLLDWIPVIPATNNHIGFFGVKVSMPE